jgi:hypothetical protein
MRRTAAAATLVLGAWLLVPIQHADAGASDKAERCVTRVEYRKVHDGMTKKRVHRIFDSAGTQTFLEGRYETRNYTPCTDRQFGWVNVSYKETRVVAKQVYWGH